MKTQMYLILVLLGLTSCRTPMEFSRPYRYELHQAITGADRIVVREGGHTCCVTPEEMLLQTVYYSTTNALEISQVIEHTDFRPTLDYNPCMCCGQPGIDWFKGDERLAITTWKHGYGILMEDGFVGMLTQDSKQWLNKWLLDHGVTEEQMK